MTGADEQHRHRPRQRAVQRVRVQILVQAEQITAMFETQRQAAAALEYILTRRRSRQRLLLLDMDGTITTSRFAVELSRATGQETALMELLDNAEDDAATRSDRIAALFRFVHRQQFERVARSAPLRPGVIEFVNRMRRAGFMVGVVSDSYFVAAEILRRFTASDRMDLSHTVAARSSPIEPGRGPVRAIVLSWATFSDAAREAGYSRRLGGIHFEQADLEGQQLGRRVADSVWTRATRLRPWWDARCVSRTV